MTNEEIYCTCVSAPPGGGHSPKCGYTLIKQFEKDTRELVFDCRDMRIERDKFKEKLGQQQKNAAFFRSCALSGEVPKDGSEPFPPKESD